MSHIPRITSTTRRRKFSPASRSSDDEGDTDRIAQIFTVPERRGEGAAKLLIAEALKRSDKELWINLTEDAAHFAPLDKLIRKAGFWVGNVSTSFRSGIEKDLSHWEQFMQKKGNRLCALIERLGFIAYSFSEAPAEFIDALYNSSYNEYGNRLDVRPFFDNEGRALDRDMSFLLVHAGEQGRPPVGAPAQRRRYGDHLLHRLVLPVDGLGDVAADRAPGVELVPDPLVCWLVLPLAMLASTMTAAALGLGGLNRVRLVEQE